MLKGNLLNRLGEAYGILIENQRQLAGGASLVKVAGSGHVLKFHDRRYAPSREILENVLTVCSRAGLIPKIIPGRDGNLVQVAEGAMFSLQEYRPTSTPAIPDPGRLARALAGLHRALDDTGHCGRLNHLGRACGDLRRLARDFGFDVHGPELEKAEEMIEARPRLIHGDLHAGNVCWDGKRIWFLDPDSLTTAGWQMDVAFLGFRIYDNPQDRLALARSYLGLVGLKEGEALADALRAALKYMLLQRILFILSREAVGEPDHLWDLPNQKSYLELSETAF